jgi:hypothetical protein
MKISKVDHIVGVRGEWRESDHGSHVALPLDASAVPDAVVELLAAWMFMDIMPIGYSDGATWARANKPDKKRYRERARAAIAALVQALGEEG